MKAIILAGGSGSRLWPLSRDMYPKQLLSLDNDYSLLQRTFLRLQNFISEEDIICVTNVKHYQDVKLQLNALSRNNFVIAEPIGKNTAPAICTALRYFNEDDMVLVVPSDHLIKDNDAFIRSVIKAQDFANEDYIVTFGIRPNYPETGYGYVKVCQQQKNGFIVDKFTEKPDVNTARKYITEGNYYWNSGMFAAKISTFLKAFEKYTPDIFQNSLNVDFENSEKIAYGIYEKMPSISVDYAIMEKFEKIALVELESDWNDLGSWQALYEVHNKDSEGNVKFGNVITNNVKNSLIYSQKEIVAASDVENIVIVETEDAIMVCQKNESQNVKILYEQLKAKASDITKLHKTVFRPWGYYTCMNDGEGYLTKTICVQPHHKLSVQSHNHRSEHWVVLEGRALILLDGDEYKLNAGESIDIPLGAKHSLQNPYDEELKIIEVQRGNYISEDDIIRYEDIYGRV